MTEPIDFDPDPREWAFEMQAYLLECEVAYRAFDTDEARRRYATLTLAGLFERLEKVPPLKGLLSVHACRDMMDFLDDVHRGRDHPWRSLGPFGGLQQYTTAEQRLRTHALVGVEIFIEAAGTRRGVKKEAFQRIADLAAAAGHELSVARLKGLYYELRSGRFPHPELVATFVRDWWMGNGAPGKIAMCDHGHPVHHCAHSGGGRCRDIFAIAQRAIPSIFADV